MPLTSFERTVLVVLDPRVVLIESIGNSFTRTVYVE